MKRFLFISSLLLGLLTFTQCKSNSSKDNILTEKRLMNNENKKMKDIDSLKYLGVEKKANEAFKTSRTCMVWW